MVFVIYVHIARQRGLLHVLPAHTSKSPNPIAITNHLSSQYASSTKPQWQARHVNTYYSKELEANYADVLLGDGTTA